MWTSSLRTVRYLRCKYTSQGWVFTQDHVSDLLVSEMDAVYRLAKFCASIIRHGGKENDMSTHTSTQTELTVTHSRGRTLRLAGALILRYGLVAVLLWVGALKFTTYEAKNIEPLVANSPLMSWAYAAFGLHGLSRLIGVVEITLGLLIATRRVSARVSAIGSLGAVVMFLVTMTFVFTTPGVWEPGYGFPFPSGNPGQFLLKDLISLGAALWTAGEALDFARAGGMASPRMDQSQSGGRSRMPFA